MEDGVGSYTYCSGLCGIISTLKILNEKGFACIDYSDIENKYYSLILDFVNYSIADNNYDFMHGAIGCAISFCDDTYFVKNVIDGLRRSSIEDKKIIKWKSLLNREGDIGYNISLSHGMSSIIVYLSLVYGKSICRNEVGCILNNSVNYILSQEVDHEKYGCFFPSQSLENKDNLFCSRLAWCYGDLGVAVALWQAAKIMENEDWKRKALEVFIYSIKRKNVENTKVIDAGICHGSAGVAMIFLYMYKETKNEIFKYASDYWIDRTIEYSMMFKDGLSGYKTLSVYQERIVWVDSYNLLEGIAGIGFVLMASRDYMLSDSLFKSMLLY